jgi:hypothetical protein
MRFEHPAFIPVNVSILPAAWMKHREQLDEIVRNHPVIFGPPKADRNYDAIWSPPTRPIPGPTVERP